MAADTCIHQFMYDIQVGNDMFPSCDIRYKPVNKILEI